MEDQYIPLNELTDNQNRIIEKLLGVTLKAGTLETVSEERTRQLNSIAQSEGLDAVEAGKLVGHFNAATKMLNRMTSEEREVFDAAMKVKFPTP